MPGFMFVFDESGCVKPCCSRPSVLEGAHTSHFHTVPVVQSAAVLSSIISGVNE